MYASTSGQFDEFLQVVRKRKWQILLPATFVFCLGAAAAVLIPQKYHAEAEFELRHVRVEKDVQRKNPDQTSTALEVVNAEDHLTNVQRIRSVIETLGWEDYQNLSALEQLEYARRHRDNLEIVLKLRERSKTGSAFVEVYYKNVDRLRSLEFLEELILAWSDELIERDEALLSAERDELQNNEEQRHLAYQEALSDVNRIERQLSVFSWTSSGNVSAGPNEDPYIKELNEISQELNRTQTALQGQRDKRAALRELIALEPDTKLVDVGQGKSDVARQVTAIETQIADKRKAQDGLTARHSRWKLLQSEIESLEAQLDRMQAIPDEAVLRQEERPNDRKLDMVQQLETLDIQIAENEGRERELLSKKADRTGLQEERLGLRRQLSEATSRVELTRKLYEDAAIALQNKRDALASLRRVNQEPFLWVQVPYAPDTPTEPNPFLIMAVGLAAGLGLGLGGAMMAEFTKSCYRSVTDVTNVMTLPVLGVVDEIVTSQQRRSAFLRGAVVLSSSAVMLGVLGWFTWAFTRAPEILPTELVQQIEELRGSFE